MEDVGNAPTGRLTKEIYSLLQLFTGLILLKSGGHDLNVQQREPKSRILPS